MTLEWVQLGGLACNNPGENARLVHLQLERLSHESNRVALCMCLGVPT